MALLTRGSGVCACGMHAEANPDGDPLAAEGGMKEVEGMYVVPDRANSRTVEMDTLRFVLSCVGVVGKIADVLCRGAPLVI